MKKHQLTGLREEIKTNANSAREFNPQIRAASGLDRHHLRQEKAGYKYSARNMLLAYAFLRGVPYLVLEKKCHDSNQPRAGVIHKIAVRFNPEATLEQCEQWLQAEMPLQQAAE